MSDRLESKLDKIIETQNSQAVTLERLTVTVEDHVRRTNLLEDDVKPIKRHVAMVDGALKFIAFCGILATIIEAIHMVFK